MSEKEKKEERKLKYVNPGAVPTHVTNPEGVTVTLEPWENHNIGAFRNRQFVVELPREFGDSLSRTGQIRRAPKELQPTPADDHARTLQEAREAAIEEARRNRAVIEAQKSDEPLNSDPYERALEKLNTQDAEAPELDVEHAAPVVSEVAKGEENLTNPAADIGGEGMTRKKKPKSK